MLKHYDNNNNNNMRNIIITMITMIMEMIMCVCMCTHISLNIFAAENNFFFIFRLKKITRDMNK